ncbi:MAG TPA: hypothetical protein VF600_01200 [Abditibacteriaceae bacterium]
MLPVFLLLGLGLSLQPRKEALTLENAEVMYIAPRGATAVDTRHLVVRVVVRYDAPSLRQQWFNDPLLDFELRLHLVTGTGQPIVPSPKSYSNFEAAGGPLYAGEISCSLADVPPSAKRLTLQVPVTLGGKPVLPVTVRVR